MTARIVKIVLLVVSSANLSACPPWIVYSRLRTLPVRSDAPITVNVLAAQSTGSSTKDVSVTLDELAGYFPNSGTAPFWITVAQGQVTKIAQQFLP